MNSNESPTNRAILPALWRDPEQDGARRRDPGMSGPILLSKASNLKRDTRGSVSLMMALTTPVLLMAAGISIEVSSWTTAQVELQRTADLAALAGGAEYTLASNAKNAAFAAADLARLNGVDGNGGGHGTPPTGCWWMARSRPK